MKSIRLCTGIVFPHPLSASKAYENTPKIVFFSQKIAHLKIGRGVVNLPRNWGNPALISVPEGQI